MIIVFMYRIQGILRHGKYIGYVSDDYEEGLDRELVHILYPVLQSVYPISSKDEVGMVILSAQRDGYDYFSDQEKDIVDLLYCNWSNQEPEIFVHHHPYKKIDRDG